MRRHLLGARKVAEPFGFPGDSTSDRHATAIEHSVPSNGRNPSAGCQNAGQIQRIGRREHEPSARIALTSDTPQYRQRLVERKLLPTEAFDEMSPADLAARLPGAIAARELAPTRDVLLALEHASADHAVAPQQAARGVLDGLRVRALGTRRRHAPYDAYTTLSFFESGTPSHARLQGRTVPSGAGAGAALGSGFAAVFLGSVFEGGESFCCS